MPPPARPAPIGWLPILIVALAGCVVYANSLSNDWVLDDFPQIVNNPWITSARHLADIFSTNAWAFDARQSSYYRPLIQVIYMVTYFVFGLKPWAFHLVNILFHAGIGVLVLLIIWRLLGASGPPRAGVVPAVAGAVLFAVHPIHTEVVAPVMGLHDLSFSLFYLLAFYLHIRDDPATPWATAGAVAAFFAALLCKEPAATLPALLIAYDVVIRKARIFSVAALKRYAPYAVVMAAYFLIRSQALGGVLQNQYSEAEMGPSGYVLNVFPLFARYLQKLLVPVDLNLVYIYRPVQSIVETRAIVSLIATAAFALLMWAAARRNRVAFLGGVFIVLPLLPALYLPGLNQKIGLAFAERYLYLPSVGYALLAACLVGYLGADWRRLPAVAGAAAMAVMAGLFCAGTIRRNRDWTNSYTLWSDAVRKSPESGAVHRDLGYALLYYKKDTAAASREFAIAMQLEPRLLEGAVRKGIAHAQMGRVDQAIIDFHGALALKADSAEAHYNLALAYEQKGWQEQAVGEYEAAIRAQPRYPDAHNNLGIAYAQKGQTDKALEHFRAAVEQKPDDPDYRANLARVTKQLSGGVSSHRRPAP